MSKPLRSLLLSALAVGTVATDVALAQEAVPSGLEEIVVTARRREENLQTIPIAVNAFSDEAIREKAIVSAVSLSALTPAFTTNNYQGRESALLPRLRALPGVRTYFAEVPAVIAGLGNFYDLQNVQVLVGPQGTLFGLNALGGAILREPKRPTNNYEGYVEGTYGSYKQRLVEGALNIPVVRDRLMIRVAGQREVRDGFTKVANLSEKLDNRNYWAWRAGVTFKPTDWIESYLVWDARTSRTNGSSYFLKASNPNGFAARFLGGQQVFENLIAQQAALGRFTQLGSNQADPLQRYKTSLLVHNLRIDINDQFTVKNIASRNSIREVWHYDMDGTSLPALSTVSPTDALEPATVTYTEELQLQGKFLDGKLQTSTGAFLLYSHIPDPKRLCSGFSNFGSTPNCTVGTVTTRPFDGTSRTQSLFAQGTLDLSALSEGLEGFKFTAGYRYNWDFFSQEQAQFNPFTGACTNPAADPRTCKTDQNAKWKAPGWTFALDYQVLPKTLVYVTARRAYTSGQLNNASLVEDLRVVKPQTNTDVEIGAKTDWQIGGIQGRTNAALFHNWFTNIIEQTTAIYTDAQGVTRSSGVLQNAAKAKMLGGELQVEILPTEWLELSGSYQYLMARYSKYPSIDPVTLAPLDLKTRTFPYAPRHNGNVTVKLNLPTDEALGEMSLQATVALMSKFVGVSDGAPLIAASRKQLDLRYDWHDVAGYPIDIGLAVQNVTQAKYPISSFNTYNSLGLVQWVYNEPRAWSVSLRYRFGE